mgnify:CR=1 FL=1
MIYRKGTIQDVEGIKAMYLEVARVLGGLARKESEITNEYIENWTSKSLKNGLWMVAEDSTKSLVGSIHAYPLEPIVFCHVLTELTIAVHPLSQGRGVGKWLFQHFLEEVRINCPSILRVELIARESNQKAIRLYESLGFQQEGRFMGRIKSVGNGFESDIPMAWLRK